MKKNKEYPQWDTGSYRRPNELSVMRIVNPVSSHPHRLPFSIPDFDATLHLRLGEDPVGFSCEIYPRPVCLSNIHEIDPHRIKSKQTAYGQIIKVWSLKYGSEYREMCDYFLSKDRDKFEGLQINLPQLTPSSDRSTLVSLYDENKVVVVYDHNLNGATRYVIEYMHHTPFMPPSRRLQFAINLPGEYNNNYGLLHIETVPGQIIVTRKFEGHALSSRLNTPPCPRIAKDSINPDDPSTYSDICQQIYLYALSLIPQESIK